MTDDERRDTFEHFLRRAVFFGECSYSSCMGIDHETWKALDRVTSEHTLEAVIEAREAFERDFTGVRMLEDRAVLRAVSAGEIASTTVRYTPEPARPPGGNVKKNVPTNYLDGMRFPDPDVAKAWIAANRANPGKIYRETVLDQS